MLASAPVTTPTESAADVVAAIARWVPELLPEPDRAESIVAACRRAVDDPSRPVDGGLCRRIEVAAHAHSRHFALFFEPAGGLVPSERNEGWPPDDPDEIARRAGSISAVVRSPEGIVTIRADVLDSFALAEPFLVAASALTLGATGLILDLGANGGGDPATVAFLAGLALGSEPVSLSAVHGRGEPVRWSSTPSVGSVLHADAPVAVLVSGATFSSAEALAYHLQARGRARVFGERTPGGADHVDPIVLSAHVHAHLPIARVVDTFTGASWEGIGVVPDASCPGGEAHDQAVAWMLS